MSASAGRSSRPATGSSFGTHDGEDDHAGRRSQLALIPYALGQGARLRAGVSQVAGNHVVIALRDDAFVALVHLRRGSLRVAAGDAVLTGQVLAECGNSGNSTQPHVHVQVTDGPDMSSARARPVSFRPFREWVRGAREPVVRDEGLPAERSVVEPLPLV